MLWVFGLVSSCVQRTFQDQTSNSQLASAASPSPVVVGECNQTKVRVKNLVCSYYSSKNGCSEYRTVPGQTGCYTGPQGEYLRNLSDGEPICVYPQSKTPVTMLKIFNYTMVRVDLQVSGTKVQCWMNAGLIDGGQHYTPEQVKAAEANCVEDTVQSVDLLSQSAGCWAAPSGATQIEKISNGTKVCVAKDLSEEVRSLFVKYKMKFVPAKNCFIEAKHLKSSQNK